jgi:hypothetical protein
MPPRWDAVKESWWILFQSILDDATINSPRRINYRFPGDCPVICPAMPRRGPEAGSHRFIREVKNEDRHSVIFLTIRPSRKTVIPPPLWETTIPTHFVTLVIAATEL